MSTLLEQYVDGHIIVLNTAHRQDRWQAFQKEMERIGVTSYVRFEGYRIPMDYGSGQPPHGHRGCTESHRAILELIAWNRWERCLVLEDDSVVRKEFANDFHKRFSEMVKEVPANSSLLYLSGHYAEVPMCRVSPHVIRCGRMFTTSAYIIGHEAARRMAPYVSGQGPIDVIFSQFAKHQHHYILEPRLMIQSPGYSDLLEQQSDNNWPMSDMRHIQLMDEGKTE